MVVAVPPLPYSSHMSSSDEPPESLARRIARPVRDWGTSLLLAALLVHLVGQLRAPSLPSQAPDFSLPLLDGGTVRLSELRGQSVVLNFWAPWCGPCRIEVPQFNRFADHHPDVAVLGLATDGTTASLRSARKKLEIAYPVVIADPATVTEYGVTTLPTTVFVDASGQVTSAHTGMLTLPQLALLTP